MIAPDIFGFDDLGDGVVLGDGTLDETSLERARLAQANCPEHAIFLDD
jgi:ferredoxin